MIFPHLCPNDPYKAGSDMTKNKTRKLPQYVHFIDGRYCIRVPIKLELPPVSRRRTPAVSCARWRSSHGQRKRHYHVAVFKEELRKAAEAYQRDTGNQFAVVSDPIDPAKLMVRQYRSMIEFDDSMRNADHRYSRHGYGEPLKLD